MMGVAIAIIVSILGAYALSVGLALWDAFREYDRYKEGNQE